MNNIKQLREEKSLSMKEVSTHLGIPYTTYVNYEKGVREPSSEMLIKIAKYFDVSIDYLIGRTNAKRSYMSDTEREGKLPPGAFPYHPTHKIPILGYISAGLPLYAEQHIEGYTYTDLNGGAEYFGLIVKGDSMNAARIYPGDTLIVRRQESVENGEIAVVMVNDENATVKHFKQKGDVVVLTPQSTNPINQPQIYNLKNTNIKIIGKVVRVEYSLE